MRAPVRMFAAGLFATSSNICYLGAGAGCARQVNIAAGALAPQTEPAATLPIAGATCIANLTPETPRTLEGEGALGGTAPLASLASDVDLLCHALGTSSRVKVVSTQRDLRHAPAIRAELARTCDFPIRIGIYAGHGHMSPEGPGNVTFAAADTPPALTAASLLSSLECPQASPPAPGAGLRSAVLFLNTCDSGYVNVAAATTPTVVIASGYGQVDGQQRTGPNTAFGDALAKALAGEADRSPPGNCDGIVSDDEAHEYINLSLHDQAASDEAVWRWKPIAVLKKNVDWQLPVAWPRERTACPRPEREQQRAAFFGALAAKPTNAEALAELKGSAEAYSNVLDGTSRVQPSGARRFLLIKSDSEGVAVAVRRAVGELEVKAAKASGAKEPTSAWQVIDASGAAEQVLLDGGRRLSYLELLLLRVGPSAFGSVYLELVRLRDRMIVWAGHVPHPSADVAPEAVALAVARRLPRSRSLLRVGDTPGLTSTVLRSLGGPPPNVVTLLRWSDLGAIDRPLVSLSVSSSAACPGGLGQCALVGDYEGDAREWFVIPQ